MGQRRRREKNLSALDSRAATAVIFPKIQQRSPNAIIGIGTSRCFHRIVLIKEDSRLGFSGSHCARESLVRDQLGTEARSAYLPRIGILRFERFQRFWGFVESISYVFSICASGSIPPAGTIDFIRLNSLLDPSGVRSAHLTGLLRRIMDSTLQAT